MQKQEINSLPKSLAEAISIKHNLYFTGVACKHGHTTYRYVLDRRCATCAKEKVKIAATAGGGNARRWANKTSEQLEKLYAKRKEYYQKTKNTRITERKKSYEKLKKIPEWVVAHRKKTNEYRASVGRLPEKSNPEVKSRYKQTVNGKAKVLANDGKRRAAKIKRTPVWLSSEEHWLIEQAYELAQLRTKIFGFSWHVDHILPLQGKLVSGLHVPENLQVIPGIENVRKANMYTPA